MGSTFGAMLNCFRGYYFKKGIFAPNLLDKFWNFYHTMHSLVSWKIYYLLLQQRLHSKLRVPSRVSSRVPSRVPISEYF